MPVFFAPALADSNGLECKSNASEHLQLNTNDRVIPGVD